MKYAILQCVNGSFKVESEGYTELTTAKVHYHGACQTLWNALDVITGKVMIVDEQLNCVDGYAEYIHHEQTEEPITE